MWTKEQHCEVCRILSLPRLWANSQNLGILRVNEKIYPTDSFILFMLLHLSFLSSYLTCTCLALMLAGRLWANSLRSSAWNDFIHELHGSLANALQNFILSHEQSCSTNILHLCFQWMKRATFIVHGGHLWAKFISSFSNMWRRLCGQVCVCLSFTTFQR